MEESRIEWGGKGKGRADESRVEQSMVRQRQSRVEGLEMSVGGLRQCQIWSLGISALSRETQAVAGMPGDQIWHNRPAPFL